MIETKTNGIVAVVTSSKQARIHLEIMLKTKTNDKVTVANNCV